MRFDFMLGRFVCTADDNIAVIMQVQFLQEYNPVFHVVLHVSIQKIFRKHKMCDCFKLHALIVGQLLRPRAKQVTLDGYSNALLSM